MCSRAISRAGVSEMDCYMMSFCKMFEDLFGPGACTPNLHLHGHVQECFLTMALLMPFGYSHSKD